MPKKKPAKKTPAKRAPKQTYIPGTEPLRIPEIEDAIATYEMHKAERLDALANEVEAKETLTNLVKENAKQLPKREGKPYYRSIDQQKEVRIVSEGESLKVTNVKQEDD